MNKINKNDLKEQIEYAKNLLEKKQIKTATLEGLINEFDRITADIHKLFANHFSEKFIAHRYGIINEAKEKSYARYTTLENRISSYRRKLELLSTQENFDRLYNSDKIASSISSTEESRKDAKSGLKELKKMCDSCKVEEEKEYLKNIREGYVNAINTLLRTVVNLINNNGRMSLLKGKDFSYLN